MKKTALVAIILALATSAFAWENSGWDQGEQATYTGNKTITGSLHVTNSIQNDGSYSGTDGTFTGALAALSASVSTYTVAESLGPELVTLDATCTGWTLASGWTCVSGTLAHDGAGTGTATYTAAGVASSSYKITHTSTITVSTGGYTIAIGGASTVSRTAAVTNQVDYLPGVGATTVLTITPGNTALRMVITALSVKVKLDSIQSSSGPVMVTRTFADATANQSGLEIVTNQTGAAGDKSALRIDMIGAGTGAEYAIDSNTGNSRTFSVTAQGVVTAVNDINSTAGKVSSGKSVTGTSGGFEMSGGLSNAVASYAYVFDGKPAANSSSGVLGAFVALPDLSNNHTTGSSYVSFYAPNLVSPDADIATYGAQVGTGYWFDFAGPGVFRKSFTKTNLTNNSAVDIFTITLAAGESMNGAVHYGLTATGGTNDIQTHSGMVTFTCVNKGGTFTKDIDEVYLAANETHVETAGTFADTWAMKAGDVCTVTLNMNSSLSSAVNTIRGEVVIYSQKLITLN